MLNGCSLALVAAKNHFDHVIGARSVRGKLGEYGLLVEGME